MEFITKTTDINKHKTQCAVVTIHKDGSLSDSAKAADSLCEGSLIQMIKCSGIKNKASSIQWLFPAKPLPFECVLVVNIGGAKGETNKEDFTKSCIAVANALLQKPIKNATWFLDGITVKQQDKQWQAHNIALLQTKQHYKYTHTKPEKTKTRLLSKLYLTANDASELKLFKKGLSAGAALGQGINLARELGNLPANLCTPTDLASHAQKLSKQYETLSTKIIDEKQMKKLGMNTLLSVSNGSEEPAKFIIMEYNGKPSKAPTVLVGKGITFDSGGISLKPGAGMDEMKYDMCGAASVFGSIEALCQMQAPIHVIAIVVAAENMPSGRATKPGDVVKSMSGQTIEILNTDAEGRLVLCDALTYVERFKPKAVIDIATLTGACVIALGSHATGLYSNNQKLADKLLAAGINADDKAWQMPLWDDYQKQLNSNFADIANIGGREAGSVTAACFLSRFTKAYHWAHLDIAGTAWRSGTEKGATGRPVGLLVNYLLNNA